MPVGTNDANIGTPTGYREIDILTEVEALEQSPDFPVIYQFGRRYFLESEPYSDD